MGLVANDTARTLTVTSSAGMCNRLRVLLSGMAIAGATERAFAMKWAPSAPCGCAFHELFENDWHVRAAVFFDTRHALDLTRTRWSLSPDLLARAEPNLYVQSYGWLYQPRLYPKHHALERRCHALMQELSPLPALAKRIRAFQANYFRPTMIGVHLRRGDHTRYRPDVTGNLANALEHVDRWLDEKNDAGILLCTDEGAVNPYSGRATANENIADVFRARYGARVVSTTPSSLDRRTPQAVQDGLVDLWLLRATNYVVGTVGSSFSELSAFGRAVPFVQTAAVTARYHRHTRWLRRLGIYEPLTRIGQKEFGRDVPYTLLIARYLVRLRVWLTGRI